MFMFDRKPRSSRTHSPASPPESRRIARLTISSPDDHHERQADEVADQVMRMTGPALSRSQVPRGAALEGIQRKCEACQDDEEGVLQAKQVTSAHLERGLDVGAAVRAAEHGGAPLPEATRRFFEPRFNFDFSRVRIHDGTTAAAAAKTVHAKAFTIGRDIVFGSGQYAPSSFEGRRLLAHELAHVVQQSGDHHTASPRVLARQEEQPQQAGGGCRKVTETPCPGVRGQVTRIEYFPSMLLANRGNCTLFVSGLDKDGNAPQFGHLELQPGESATFAPQEGTVGVGFGCVLGCNGTGRLEHPYLCA